MPCIDPCVQHSLRVCRGGRDSFGLGMFGLFEGGCSTLVQFMADFLSL